MTPTKHFEKGHVREDGYIFLRYQTKDGVTYPVFISPLALANAKAKQRAWRHANLDKARAAVRRWKDANVEKVRKHNRESIRRKREREKLS